MGEFLPLWMRSLEPMDRILCAPMTKMCGCKPKEDVESKGATESQTAAA